MTATRPAPVTSASLALEVESKLRSRHICADPAAAARLCMDVVLPHLKALAGENERLRGLVAEYVVSGNARLLEEVTALRAHALLNGIPLADLERIRDAARAGKSSSKGEKP